MSAAATPPLADMQYHPQSHPRSLLRAARYNPLATVGAVRILETADVDAEAFVARVDARREELRKEVARGEKKLGNKGFVDKAPPEVVQEEREKLDAYRRELESLGG